MQKLLPKLIGFVINSISYVSASYAAKLAIQLFSKPRKGKLNASEATFLNTAKQQQFKKGNINIQTYKWAGSEKTVLLVHGWESNSFRWQALVKTLKAKNYTIVAIDAPAHGATSGNTFNAVIYAECIAKVTQHFKPQIIIGHSVGGMATVFALKNHKMPSVTTTVLLGAPDCFRDILNSYVKLMGFSKRVNTAIDAHILEKFNYTPDGFSTAAFCETVSTRCLIIHDKKDRIIPFKDGIAIHKAFKNATFISTKGFGHGLKSETVYNHILTFLNTQGITP